MDHMSGPNSPKGLVVVWAGDLDGGLAVRERLRHAGWAARLLDAREFHRERKPEPAHVVVFVGAPNHVEIQAAYVAAGYAGEFEVLGLDGQPVPDAANTAMSPAAVAEPDRQTAEMHTDAHNLHRPAAAAPAEEPKPHKRQPRAASAGAETAAKPGAGDADHDHG
jgi:hypothetical protein